MMSSEVQYLIETEIFCNIANAFTATFDQFNVSLSLIGNSLVNFSSDTGCLLCHPDIQYDSSLSD